MLQRTAGAKHVIQRLVLQGKPRKTETGILPWKAINVARRQNVGPEPPQEEKELFDDLVYLDKNKIAADMRQTAREGLDADNSVLFIEFMHRGRFSDYIGKAGRAQAPFPSPALWQIFDCRKSSRRLEQGEKAYTHGLNSVPCPRRFGVPGQV